MEVTPSVGLGPVANTTQSPSTPKESANAVPPLEDILSLSAEAKAALDSAKSPVKDSNNLSPQARAMLMRLGNGVFASSPGKQMDLGDALAAITQHYDKMFSDMSEKIGSSQNYKNDWDKLNGIINEYLKEHVDKMGKSSDIDLGSALSRGQKTAETFLSAFSSKYSEGIEAALNSAKEAIAKMSDASS